MPLSYCELCQSKEYLKEGVISLTRVIKGESFTLNIDTDLCRLCESNPAKVKRELRRLFNDAYRAKHDLVTTLEIKTLRKMFGLNQRDFARLIGLGEISVARYESGFIPSKANSLRIRQLNHLDQLKTIYKDTKEDLSENAIKQIDRYIENFVSIENGNRIYDKTRFFALTAFFIKLAQESKIKMYVTKLNKYMFYSDFLAFKRIQQSLTGSRYVRLSFGPVPNRYDFKYDMNPYIKTEIEEDKVTYHLSEEPFDESIFSPQEKDIIYRVFDRLKGMRSSEVSELSHQEKAWTKTTPGNFVSYHHAKDLLIDP
jgi:putative zinc finger/helix-turn-helix YgiT family protein